MDELGESNADFALEGFRAFLGRADRFPSVDAQLQLREENKHYVVSYLIQAGFDEEWTVNPDLNSFDDERLKSAIAIDLLCPAPDYTNDRRNIRGWKRWLLANWPALIHQVYFSIVRYELARDRQHIEGLHELLTHRVFQPFRAASVIQLLAEFPNAPGAPLVD